MRVDSELDTSRPFTRQSALHAGIGDRALCGRHFTAVVRGVYVAAQTVLTDRVRAQAVLLALPEATISGRSAARLWGAIVPDSADVEVMLGRTERTELAGVRMHRPAQRLATTTRFGLRVLTPEATFVRLAAELELIDLVVAGDSLVKAGHTTPAALIAAAASAHTRRCTLARRAARLVRSGVDSPQESRLRLLLVLAGLPEPQVNIVLRDAEGGWVYRLDMGYPEIKLALEYDGRQHAQSTAQWSKDVRRRQDLDDLGWRLVVVLSPDLFLHPDQLLDTVTRLLRAAGVGVRRSSEWQRHFPVRKAVA